MPAVVLERWVALLARRCRMLLAGRRFSEQEELHWLGCGILACCDPALKVEDCRRIIAVVSQGGFWLSARAWPLFMQHLQQRSEAMATPTAGALQTLTGRERDVAQLVADGSSNKQIARALNITDRTVKTHLTAVFSKLGVADRLQLALLLHQQQSTNGQAAQDS
ncbi:response regulator transcription factor [Chitinilyticum litopenaei]|uniref:Response regulator transcription factor n=2 Tax=Chitinilyticum piscinae TaxID=2866724 RepID=A0A8J7FKC0_9NEIS|nr:response regulator transcription factor [Chitinilyticum piscinae]